jgi:hypothetical protein
MCHDTAAARGSRRAGGSGRRRALSGGPWPGGGSTRMSASEERPSETSLPRSNQELHQPTLAPEPGVAHRAVDPIGALRTG